MAAAHAAKNAAAGSLRSVSVCSGERPASEMLKITSLNAVSFPTFAELSPQREYLDVDRSIGDGVVPTLDRVDDLAP